MPLVEISKVGDLWRVKFQYHWSLVDAMKEVGGRWDEASRCWTFASPESVQIIDNANLYAKDADDFFFRVQQACVSREQRIKMIADPAEIARRVPDGLALRDYQVEGVKWIAEHPSTLLADEMGTGKTIQVAAALNCCPDVKRVLIICPASLKRNWYAELRGDPDIGKRGWLIDTKLTVGIASGMYFPNCNIVIINYDLLGRHKEKIDSAIWDFCIVDECHYLKNLSAGRTVAVVGRKARKLRDGTPLPALPPICASRKIAMSGTPLVNRPAELFAILHWLDPKRWPSFFWFAKRFCNATRGRFGMSYNGASRLDELNARLLRTTMIRRTKAEVLKDLPPKVRQVIEFDAPEIFSRIREENLFAAKLQRDVSQFRAAVEIARINRNEAEYREAVDKLRAAISDGVSHIAELRREIAIAKVPYVIDHARNLLLGGSKLIVFAHHRDVVFALKAGIGKHFGTRFIIGGMADIERQQAINAFQNDDSVRCIVCSMQAAGVGLTLTAAQNVVFAELDWVPAVVRQAEDRAHRIGQKSTLLIQHIVASGSLDAMIAKRLVSKQAILDAVLDGSGDLDAIAGDSEPVDWLEEMRPTVLEESELRGLSEKMTPYHRACALYAARTMASSPPFGIAPSDLVIVSRFAALDSLTERQSAFIASVASRYRGGWDWFNEAQKKIQKELDNGQKTML